MECAIGKDESGACAWADLGRLKGREAGVAASDTETPAWLLGWLALFGCANPALLRIRRFELP